MVVSAGWSVPVGRGPTGGRAVDRSARGTAGVEGWRRKSSSNLLHRLEMAGRTFFGPRHRAGRVLFPISQRNRPVRVLVQVSKTRRAKREVDPHR